MTVQQTVTFGSARNAKPCVAGFLRAVLAAVIAVCAFTTSGSTCPG